MHLINDAFQSLTAPITAEQLGEMHKDSLGEIEAIIQKTGMLARNSSVATKVEQIMSEVASGREEREKVQDQKFSSLIESLKNRSARGQAEQAFKPGTVKVVAPVAQSKQAERASFKEYLSFAQNPANAGKIILGVRRNGIESGRCVLEKQKGNNYIAVIGDDQVAAHLIPEQQREITDNFLTVLRLRFGSKKVERCFSKQDYEEALKQGLSSDKISQIMDELDQVFSGPINDIYQETKTVRSQITTLGKQVGIEGGARNKKFADQAKLLEQKARDLVAQLPPLKEHSNADVQNDAFYVERRLHNAIDEVGQLVEATQQNRNLVDGLGLEAKPWHGEPLSAEEGKEIIDYHEEPGIALTWRDVGDDDEIASGEEISSGGKISHDKKTIFFDQVSEADQTDKDTDSDNGSPGILSVSDSPKSLSSRSSSISLGSLEN